MTGFYAVWPFFVAMALILALAATPLLKIADSPPHDSGKRIPTLDGLRGFLALAVFFSHGAVYHVYNATGVWADAPSQFYRDLGPLGVDLFFMITGFLFWSILIKAGGKPNWAKLYVGRVFRIGPLYVFAASLGLILILMRTGLALHEAPGHLIKGLVKWEALGLWGGRPDINGLHHSWLVMAGVVWTLRYEWFFYFSLVVTSLAARNKTAGLYFPVAIVAGLLVFISRHDYSAAYIDPAAICAALFAIGAVCAAIKQRDIIAIPKHAASALSLALMASFFLFQTPFAALPIVALGGAFFLIVFGADMFGLLSLKAARRLGNASYGIYLLQGLVLSFVFFFKGTRGFEQSSPVDHWVAVMLCGVVLVLLAAVAHFLVEMPGVRLGEAAIKTVAEYRPPAKIPLEA